MLRTNREIIEDGGGWRETSNKLGLVRSDTRVKFWYFRDSIPADYWNELAKAQLTTLEELATAAARKRYLKERTVIRPKVGRPRKEEAA